MHKTAIILAGGSGSRAGGDRPKQLQLLGGKPVFVHSIEKFLDQDPDTHIVLVVNTVYSDVFRDITEEMSHRRRFCCSIVSGGPSRAESVMNALETLDPSPGSLVAVHDAARPLLSVEMVARGWKAAIDHGAAVPAVPMTDSIRALNDDGSSHSVPRTRYVAVQTPQVFDGQLLADAYKKLGDPASVTDDASVAEMAGHRVALYEGEHTNMKITGPHDLAIASVIAKGI